jgi:ribosomal protein S18 acetylase RimI-like enzyme
MTAVKITVAVRGSRDLDDAANIWAEATAARDHKEAVADLSIARPVLEAVLDRSAGSFVIVARADDDGAAVGFAAVEPTAGEERTAQVSYLGVRPGAWGGGVGVRLLSEVSSRLASSGYRRVELLVYVDNYRAIRLYERAGWTSRGAPTPHPRTGKLEQRYELRLPPTSG